MELICECPFEHRKRCGELLSSLMIEAGAEKVDVPQKCDVECFGYWYGEDISLDDTPEAFAQFKDLQETGSYKSAEYYKNYGG